MEKAKENKYQVVRVTLHYGFCYQGDEVEEVKTGWLLSPTKEECFKKIKRDIAKEYKETNMKLLDIDGEPVDGYSEEEIKELLKEMEFTTNISISFEDDDVYRSQYVMEYKIQNI